MTQPKQTKMLHELIELAVNGKKFNTKSPSGVWCNHFALVWDFKNNAVFSVRQITQPWEYEEIREPQVVEIECHWDLSCLVLRDILKELNGKRWKIVATEVVE